MSAMADEDVEPERDERLLGFYDGTTWLCRDRKHGLWFEVAGGDRESLDRVVAEHEERLDTSIEPGLWFYTDERLIPVNSQTIDKADDTPIDLPMMLTTGATYRQIDYWCRQHYLTDDRITTGSGNNRTWTLADYVIAALVLRLSATGIEVAYAVRAAEFAVFNGAAGANLGNGVKVSWTQPT